MGTGGRLKCCLTHKSWERNCQVIITVRSGKIGLRVVLDIKVIHDESKRSTHLDYELLLKDQIQSQSHLKSLFRRNVES